MIAVTPELDVGIRIEPFAPMLARIKYQLVGNPEAKAESGNFSLSASGAGGLLLATYEGNGVAYYCANGALIGGIRFARHHLASVAPFFGLSGLSGVGSASGSGTRYGASLGYQYDIEALILRAELTWAKGSMSRESGPAQPSGFFPGVLLGLKL